MAWTWTKVGSSFRRFCTTVTLTTIRNERATFQPLLFSCITNQTSSFGCKRTSYVFMHTAVRNSSRPLRERSCTYLFKETGTLPFTDIQNQNRLALISSRKFSTSLRHFASNKGKNVSSSNTSGMIYILAVFILMIGGSYAAVPLYRVFCQVSGLGGQAQRGRDAAKLETMEKVDRQIKVRFNADVASSMRWNFKPQQTEVIVAPGETALAFYTAKNPTDKPIIGISTYNVLPFDAGQYFNKIQCFCFEEQRLNPNEQVDMPVFFYIDPDFAEDPKLETIHTITLSYTFFEAKEGLSLPLPGYPQPHDPPVPA